MAFVVPSIMVASGMRIHLPACVALRPGARVKQRLFANVPVGTCTSYLPMETLVGGIQLSLHRTSPPPLLTTTLPLSGEHPANALRGLPRAASRQLDLKGKADCSPRSICRENVCAREMRR